jgi:hypothetical protein
MPLLPTDELGVGVGVGVELRRPLPEHPPQADANRAIETSNVKEVFPGNGI